MTKAIEIHKWQQAMKEQPKVWITWYQDFREEETIGSIYDSKEAAEVELFWHQEHGDKRTKCFIRFDYILNLELSKQRWTSK